MTTEKDTQRTVLEFLSYRKDLLYWRNNAGGTVIPAGNNKRRFIKLGETGSPDIYVLKSGTLYGLEIKGSDEKKCKQSENQIIFEKKMNDNGGIYKVIRDIDSVISLFS